MSIVDEFLAAIESQRFDDAWALLDDDVVYDNVPIGPMTGRDAVRSVLAPFFANFDEISWPVSHQVHSGDDTNGVVMNSRVDRFRAADRWVELPVAGLFEVTNGKITLWRDYFDLPTYQQQMAALGG